MRINLQAPLNTTGYGVVSHGVLRELSKTHEVALWPIGGVDSQDRGLIHECHARTKFYDPAAPSLRIWHEFDLAQHIGKGIRAAYPIFELDRLKPSSLHHVKSQDVVFVTSKWYKAGLMNAGVPAEKIVVAPPGVDKEIFSPCEANSTGPTTFVNIGKYEYRKGHDVLLEAFCRAFKPTDDVRLVMLSENPCFSSQDEKNAYNGEWNAYYKNSPMGAHIELLPRQKGQREVAEVMSRADCGVFPARAEGWGLESAEMLAMGKEVILTNYSGHTEYMTADNSRWIQADGYEVAHDGKWFRRDDPEWVGNPGCWAKLSEGAVEQLVDHMREVHAFKQSGDLGINQAGIDSMARFTWKNTADIIVGALGG